MLLMSLASVGAARAADLESLEQKAMREAVARVAPSVVRIETIGGREKVEGILLGSGPTTGLVVGEDGYIVSSAFNFLQEPASILVQVPGGARKPARLVATDHSRMVVLLKIEPEQPLAVAEFVPKSEICVGQWAIAVGRAFEGDRPNMAVGVVSALNRVWGKAIQCDAAVSPNNYGGPLVDIRGRVLGLLLPLSPEAADEAAGWEWYDSGIGFAIPGYDIRAVLPRLKQGKDLRPGLIGISFAGENLATAEPVIGACRPNSPAYQAGIRANDRIVRIADRQVRRAAEVKEELSRRYAGDTVQLVVLRGKETIDRQVTLAEKLEPYARPFLGILPARPPKTEGNQKQASGIAVRYVFPRSPAAEAGIEVHDVLLAAAGEPVQDAGSLRQKLADRKPGDRLELEVCRGDQTRTLSVRLARQPEEIPAADLPFSHPDAPPEKGRPGGTVELKLPESENKASAYVPETYNSSIRYGVVLWLGGKNVPEEKTLLARWKPVCDRHDLIFVSPRRADPRRWTSRDLAFVKDFLAELETKYPVDPSRIVVGGQAEGGMLGYLLAFRERPLVRAVIAVDAPLPTAPPDNEPVYPLVFFIARARKSEFAEAVEKGIARLRQMQYPVTVQDLGDEPRDLSAEELASVGRWIDALDRI